MVVEPYMGFHACWDEDWCTEGFSEHVSIARSVVKDDLGLSGLPRPNLKFRWLTRSVLPPTPPRCST